MKKRLGISIYPEIVGKEKTLKYILLAKEAGFERIFANLLELNDDKEGNERLEMFKEVFTFGKDNGFEVIVDVNPNFYHAFKLKNTELQFFKDLGATGIRLDEDFKGTVESVLSNNKIGMKIELNASGGSETITATLDKGGNPEQLIACHNFYPMRYTGLQYERFIELSSFFKAKGIRVAAFVTLDQKRKGVGPWDVNEGMPTIEEHRFLSVAKQVESLLSLKVIDDIIISQQGAIAEDFNEIKTILDEYNAVKGKGIVELKVNSLKNMTDIEKSILNFERELDFEGSIVKTHSNRPDYTGYFIRSTITRITYKDENIGENNSGKKLNIGDVVVLNENLGRYKGEVHIITAELDDTKQKARNLIGHIAKEDIFKLAFVDGGTKFKLNLDK